MLKTESLCFKWQGQAEYILKNINFTLQQGEILCICGINGCGKSSLLQVLAGLEQAEGEYFFQELKIDKKNISQLRLRTALLMQDPNVQILGYTVFEDVLLPFDESEIEKTNQAESLIQSLNLSKDALVSTLSYGQKRKLCLASALIREPELLLLDEPFSALDYPACLELRKIILANKQNCKAQIITSHELESIVDLADKILILDQGTQSVYGDPKEVLTVLSETKQKLLRLPCSWRLNRTVVEY